MHPLVAYAKCSFIDFCRRARRRFAQEPLLAIGTLAALSLCAAFVFDAATRWGLYLEGAIPFVVMGYGLYKVLQDPPALSMRACVISFEMFSLRQMKTMFVARLLLPTVAFVALYGFVGLRITPLFAAACFLNVAANFISLVKHGAKAHSISIVLVASYLASILFTLASSSLMAPVLVLAAAVGVFVVLRAFVYDDWYPYCQGQQLLHDALVEGDRNLISLSCQGFFKAVTKRFLRVDDKGYDLFLYERICLSRLRNHWKGLVACVFASIVAGIAVPCSVELSVAWRAALIVIPLVVLDVFLSTFNGADRDMAATNPLFDRSVLQMIRRGYVVQAAVAALVVLCGMASFSPFSILFSILCCVFFPVQNMCAVEASSSLGKIAGCVFKSVVVGLPLWGFSLSVVG